MRFCVKANGFFFSSDNDRYLSFTDVVGRGMNGFLHIRLEMSDNGPEMMQKRCGEFLLPQGGLEVKSEFP